MIDRRSVLIGLAVAIATPAAALAQQQKALVLEPQYLPQQVAYTAAYEIGTVVVDTKTRFLYLIEAPGVARRYGIGVGMAGLAWSGTADVARKAKWPAWRPTANMIKRNPGRYEKYADGMPGGKGNPLGSRALYLYRDGKDTMYRIHGTTEPWTIGRAVSNGCIRMVNEHVEDLYERVPVGAKVVVQ